MRIEFRQQTAGHRLAKSSLVESGHRLSLPSHENHSCQAIESAFSVQRDQATCTNRKTLSLTQSSILMRRLFSLQQL